MAEMKYIITLRPYEQDLQMRMAVTDDIHRAHQWVKALMLEWMANRDLGPDDLNAPHIYLAIRELQEGNIFSFEIAKYLEIGALKWAAMRLFERFDEIYLPLITIHEFLSTCDDVEQIYVENITSVYEGCEDE